MNSQKPHYLKQYTCYEFTNYISNASSPKISMKLISKGKDICINNTLRNQVLDSFDLSDKLYILKWQFRNANSTIVDIFPFNSQIFNRIEMDQRPSFITIIDKHIYLIIGTNLQIIRYENMALEKTYSLGTDMIHAVEAAFSETHNNQIGVYIYSWNQKKGYHKRFYSLYNKTEQKWWSNLVNMRLFESVPSELKKSTLKVLIPNVIGVIIQDSSTIVLINLKSMQVIQRCNKKLTKWLITNPNKCIIKQYAHTKSQGYDDSLLISIGQKDRQFIQLFVFHIKYIPQITRKYQNQISIRNTQTGEIIDWNRSNFQSFLTFSTEGELIDYLLTSQGIIYYSKTKSMIPTAGFSYYQNPLRIYPILPLEHNIFSSYLIDNETYIEMEQLTKQMNSAQDDRQKNQLQDQFEDRVSKLVDSVLRPNRYSKSFILASTEAEYLSQIFKQTKLKPLKMLSDWHKYFKVKSLFLLNDDIIIVRQNSITSLLPISQQQYESQYQNPQIFQQAMNKISQGQPIKSLYSFEMSLNQSKYSINKPQIIFGQFKQNWWIQMNQIYNSYISYERLGISYDSNQNPNQYEKIFQKYIQKLLQKINIALLPSSQIQQKGSITNKSIIFAQSLITNRVKDLILFYSKIIKYTFIKSSQTNSTETSYGKKQKNIVNYLSMLQNILTECSRQYLGLGNDLISQYIEQSVDKLLKNIINAGNQKQKTGSDSMNQQPRFELDQSTDIIIDVQKQSWKIIKNMLTGIIFIQNNSDISLNSFIKLLIDTLERGHEYIGNLLLNTFNPYESIFPLDYNPNQQQLYGQQEYPFTSWSLQQSQFQLTPTLLTIYSYLDIPYDAKITLFTCFITKNLSSQEDEKLFYRILNSLRIDQSMKQNIKKIYLEVKGMQGKYALDSESSKRQKRIDQGKYKKKVEIKQQIDNSENLMYITRIIEADVLQKYLIELEQEQLQKIFRINIETMLDQNLQSYQTINRTINGQNYTAEDYLTSWIMKYRVYVLKLNKWIQLIQQNSSDSDLGQYYEVKRVALAYVKICIHSFKNVRKYYQDLYKIKKIKQKIQKNCHTINNINLIQTDEQIIQKVCCRMIGFQDVSQLYLYKPRSKLINPQHLQGNAGRILPTPNFFQLILIILKDNKAHPFTIQDPKSILYYYLKNVLEQPTQQNLQYFIRISNYFSRQWLSQFIQNTSILRQLYINLPDSVVGRQLKGYFGYCQNLQRLSNSVNKMSLTIPQRQSSGKVGKNMPRQSQNMNIMQEQRNNNLNLPFRNAYLQVMGSD